MAGKEVPSSSSFSAIKLLTHKNESLISRRCFERLLDSGDNQGVSYKQLRKAVGKLS